jgi:hypothetical protein
VRATRTPTQSLQIPANALGPRSPRDPRRLWARWSSPPEFHNPAAIELAEWAGAILFLESWAAWQRAHPEGDDPL